MTGILPSHCRDGRNGFLHVLFIFYLCPIHVLFRFAASDRSVNDETGFNDRDNDERQYHGA